MIGNVYVKYADEEEAEACLSALLGRYYDGNAPPSFPSSNRFLLQIASFLHTPVSLPAFYFLPSISFFPPSRYRGGRMVTAFPPPFYLPSVLPSFLPFLIFFLP
jgi:hypothetical protein